MPLLRDALFEMEITKCLLSQVRVVLQAQVLAMMGQTKEAEKITNHIVSEETGCLECYRLLSAIYSKQELYDKKTTLGTVFRLQSRSDINNS